MLQSEADMICSEEDLEMLSLLPQLDGLHVLELSAGISPFAGKIAGSATHVTTVDCVKMDLEKILPQKKCVQNVEHLQADVTKLDFPKATFDVIISSFQFMHLDEETLKALTRCLIRWLRPGGHLFFREFCSRQPDNASMHRGSRKQADYNHIMQKTTEEQKCEGEMHGFDLVFSKCMNVKHKEDPLHFCWLLKKVTRSGKNCSLEEFLETERFSRRFISHNEWLFGQGFLSSGGLSTFLEMLSLLNLQPGEKVLDVGSGTGGAAFYMAKMFGVEVLGIDLCLDAFEIAQKRLIGENVPKVQFELCDATMREFPENTFDVVYSKDSILYTMDKFSLFQKFHACFLLKHPDDLCEQRWLKPTGRFIISDFCCGEKPWSEEFQKFADQSGYILWTLSAMGKSLQDAGFAEVHVTDSNQKMGKSMNNYLKYIIDNQAEFVKNFSQAEYDDFVRIWKCREKAFEDNYFSWGVFQGKKKLAVNRPV